MNSMDDMAAFLAARYDEAEAMAKEAGGYLDSGTPEELVIDLSQFTWRGKGIASSATTYIAMNRPRERQADIKLKRAILAEHKHYPAFTPDEFDFGCGVCHDMGDYGVVGNGWCTTVRHLGTEFSDHPDYKPGWRPDDTTAAAP